MSRVVLWVDCLITFWGIWSFMFSEEVTAQSWGCLCLLQWPLLAYTPSLRCVAGLPPIVCSCREHLRSHGLESFPRERLSEGLLSLNRM